MLGSKSSLEIDPARNSDPASVGDHLVLLKASCTRLVDKLILSYKSMSSVEKQVLSYLAQKVQKLVCRWFLFDDSCVVTCVKVSAKGNLCHYAQFVHNAAMDRPFNSESRVDLA